MPLTKLQIIEETVAFYSEDVSRRATGVGDSCHYATPDGRNCAVGRCLENPKEVVNATANSVFEQFKFKPEYEGHPPGFWRDLQKLHDPKVFWEIGGLTKDGLEYLDRLKNIYK